MKIICNKEEFASLVRNCLLGARYEACAGCPFRGVCSAGGEPVYDEHIMSRIEDICEIEVDHG